MCLPCFENTFSFALSKKCKMIDFVIAMLKIKLFKDQQKLKIEWPLENGRFFSHFSCF